MEPRELDVDAYEALFAPPMTPFARADEVAEACDVYAYVDACLHGLDLGITADDVGHEFAYVDRDNRYAHLGFSLDDEGRVLVVVVAVDSDAPRIRGHVFLDGRLAR